MSARMWQVAGAAGAAAVLVLSWLLLIGPQREEAAAVELETASQRAATSQLRARVSLLKKQSEELPAQEAKLASIQQRIPERTEIPTLIRTLSGLASGASVSITALDPARPAPIVVEQATPVATEAPTEGEGAETDAGDGPPAQPETAQVQAVRVSINVCGDFSDVRTYMRELESMRRVVSVTNLNVVRGTCEGSDTESLNAQITASAFTMSPSAATGGQGAASATGPDAATTGAS